LSRARREAEQLVAAAHSQADSISAAGQADAERELAAVRTDLEQITRRRDAISAQLASLKDVVAGFTGDDA
jgi:regulator of protease activity HflC (stomatin/prohibitin superfamily)